MIIDVTVGWVAVQAACKQTSLPDSKVTHVGVMHSTLQY
jgi:hypothetical protein